ncbi:hypothetical protein AVDCRST_MAG82-1907 [uncultured Rubrobacteraceae bacterium]|uniref:Uncharacterized protein n=1 Tax=uncultured Rubrobacteraceae bacterium TaxID=349277 RepID=A0A6J4PWV4_9ACTN|nr:hypothetical protein AVDCRST_MAG82-1907 [uncultured Rubrobacteraceae bacterium]
MSARYGFAYAYQHAQANALACQHGAFGFAFGALSASRPGAAP